MGFHGHTARKRFGQHWLKDEVVLRKIIEAANLQSKDRVLEVGPGRGALTAKLLDSKAAAIHAIEIDRDLVVGLQERFSNQSRFTLKEGDVLSMPLQFPDGLVANKVVANIPYNITGPLLERLVGRLGAPIEITYEKLILLLQKEVADRILAKPGQSNFSALTVRLHFLASSNCVCDVPPKCFQPSPKVHSQVIELEPIKPEERLDDKLAKGVDALLRTAFLSRRKMLRNSLRGLKSFNELSVSAEASGIRLNKRPQELSPAEWLILAKSFNQINNVAK